jgi:hypothetical protein
MLYRNISNAILKIIPEQVDKMGVLVGYPDEIFNDALLNSAHKQVSISRFLKYYLTSMHCIACISFGELLLSQFVHRH